MLSASGFAQRHRSDELLILGFPLSTYTNLHISDQIYNMNNVLSAFHLGQEYPAIVEFAPFQKVSKKKLKKKDAKAGSIEEGICDFCKIN